MTDEQRAALSPHSPEYQLRVIGSKIQLAGWSTYSVLLWSLKASLLVFYLRLTVRQPPASSSGRFRDMRLTLFRFYYRPA